MYIGPKKVALFLEIGRVKNSRMCVRIYIFNFKKQRTNKQKKSKNQKNKTKGTKEEKK